MGPVKDTLTGGSEAVRAAARALRLLGALAFRSAETIRVEEFFDEVWEGWRCAQQAPAKD